MKVRVHYRDGLAVDFAMPGSTSMDDFVRIAKVHGIIKSIEFPE